MPPPPSAVCYLVKNSKFICMHCAGISINYLVSFSLCICQDDIDEPSSYMLLLSQPIYKDISRCTPIGYTHPHQLHTPTSATHPHQLHTPTSATLPHQLHSHISYTLPHQLHTLTSATQQYIHTSVSPNLQKCIDGVNYTVKVENQVQQE